MLIIIMLSLITALSIYYEKSSGWVGLAVPGILWAIGVVALFFLPQVCRSLTGVAGICADAPQHSHYLDRKGSGWTPCESTAITVAACTSSVSPSPSLSLHAGVPPQRLCRTLHAVDPGSQHPTQHLPARCEACPLHLENLMLPLIFAVIAATEPAAASSRPSCGVLHIYILAATAVACHQVPAHAYKSISGSIASLTARPPRPFGGIWLPELNHKRDKDSTLMSADNRTVPHAANYHTVDRLGNRTGLARAARMG